MTHQIYTVIFMQGINRTSNVQNRIVVAGDEFMGAHTYLSLAFIIMSIALYLVGEAKILVPQYHKPKLS